MDVTACHPSGAYNFEVFPRLLENMCTPDFKNHVTKVKKKTLLEVVLSIAGAVSECAQ